MRARVRTSRTCVEPDAVDLSVITAFLQQRRGVEEEGEFPEVCTSANLADTEANDSDPV